MSDEICGMCTNEVQTLRNHVAKLQAALDAAEEKVKQLEERIELLLLGIKTDRAERDLAAKIIDECCSYFNITTGQWGGKLQSSIKQQSAEIKRLKKSLSFFKSVVSDRTKTNPEAGFDFGF